jgi:hypothetical protein
MARLLPALVVASLVVASAAPAQPPLICPEEQPSRQLPTDLKLCDELDPIVRAPRALPLDRYQAALGKYVQNFCHRDLRKGWRVDKHVRDTGPFVANYVNGNWAGNYFGTHAPVLVWYSPEMFAWLKANRAGEGTTASSQPVPDGAIMIKEMYTPPASACAGVAWERLAPLTQGAAVMVRDAQASYDGWFWGWFGWPNDWQPDWPNRAAARAYPFSGFGLYCTNCHASAQEQTFAALRNIAGETGDPLVFLTQNFFLDSSWQSLDARIAKSAKVEGATKTRDLDAAFARTFAVPGGAPKRSAIVSLPSETYDNVWVGAGPPSHASQYVTSDQCLGCHSAGGTGLQFDMTEPGSDGRLINNSPYGTWRGSPMGLSGRDPIFFAQLASETEAFHPEAKAQIEDTCLGCHGVLGQRQAAIDSRAAGAGCGTFARTAIDAVPDAGDDPVRRLADYGALARDGVSCTACHRMVLGNANASKYHAEPQNACVLARQQALNPDLAGFAKTFTGSFLTGAPDKLFGPFQDPKAAAMKHAIGSAPEHAADVKSSEMCGSCHTVHLPVLQRGQTIGRIYEQTTYPEWAFSDYRDGKTPDGALPLGAGASPQSCQDCHMPSNDTQGAPYRSKIAAIQESSNFPQAEHTLPPSDIDLPTRTGVAKHTLVGLNVFLLKMAWQFADIFGIRLGDPMLSDHGVEPIPAAEAAMLEQAAERTASVSVDQVTTANGVLSARVTVLNKVGHKFPSGVSFRRAFLAFEVRDDKGKELWASGRTNRIGVIVDEKGTPIAGELWWRNDCSARVEPQARLHQPHYQVIGRQDQAQIYEELLASPPEGSAPVCGAGAAPQGGLTTSFLSICSRVKDNRLLPRGFLKLDDRTRIATALGADRHLAEDTSPVEVDNDPDYASGGGDTLVYRVPLAGLAGKPATVTATLYYQATPPYFLQDRFCTSDSADTRRLYYVAGNLRLDGTPAQSWKLRLTDSGPVSVP